MSKLREQVLETFNVTYNLAVQHCINKIELLDKHGKLNKEEIIKELNKNIEVK